jgi:hypothetical protein
VLEVDLLQMPGDGIKDDQQSIIKNSREEEEEERYLL